MVTPSTKWYGKAKWLVYVKLQRKLYKKNLGESPSNVGVHLLGVDSNDELKNHLQTDKHWERAQGTPWNDGHASKNYVVFVVDVKMDPGMEGHLRMLLYPEGKLTDTYTLVSPEQLDSIAAGGRLAWGGRMDKKKKEKPRPAPKERVKKLWNCRPKKLKKKGEPYESCTYAHRRDDGKSGTTKRCESENKNCLLLSARRNLSSAVTKDSWIKIWKDLAPAPVAARYLPGE